MEKAVATLLQEKTDARGRLFEILRRETAGGSFGQVYYFESAPGAARGNHYHDRKDEWFCVLEGKARVVLKDLESGETRTMELDGSKPAVLRVPAGVGHGIVNAGEGPLKVIAYVSEPFDPQAPDTTPLKLV